MFRRLWYLWAEGYGLWGLGLRAGLGGLGAWRVEFRNLGLTFVV